MTDDEQFAAILAASDLDDPKQEALRSGIEFAKQMAAISQTVNQSLTLINRKIQEGIDENGDPILFMLDLARLAGILNGFVNEIGSIVEAEPNYPAPPSNILELMCDAKFVEGRDSIPALMDGAREILIPAYDSKIEEGLASGELDLEDPGPWFEQNTNEGDQP